jgi:uncharacterized protein
MPRYLGNAGTTQFHDLSRVRPQCQVARVVAGGRDRYFTPDTVEQALRQGFEPCWFCIGTVMDLLIGALGGPLDAPADLAGEDRGGGRVTLRWTYPVDPAHLHIAFDVHSSTDPLDPYRTLRLGGHPGTSAELIGLQPGEHFFTVVAHRGNALSLPARPLRLLVGRSAPLVATGGRRPGGGIPRGLGFPFAVDGRGGILEQSGDPLLHGKILQLLLTAPGERVNRPEYGTRLRDVLFDPNDEILAATTEFAVTRALQRFLGDQLHVEEVRVRADDAALQVHVVYVRKADLQRQQFRAALPFPNS